MLGRGTKTQTREVRNRTLDYAAVITDVKFADFMQDVYGDLNLLSPDDEKDQETIEQRYNAYKKRENVTNKLVGIYEKEIPDILKVSSADIHKGVEKHLAELIRQSPERIDELLAEIEEFVESEKQINTRQRVIDKYEKMGGQNALQKKAHDLGAATARRKWKSLGMMLHEDGGAVEHVKNQYKIMVDDIKSKLAETQSQIKEIATAEFEIMTLKATSADVRRNILQDSDFAKEMATLAQEALKNKMGELMIESSAPRTKLTKLGENMNFLDEFMDRDPDRLDVLGNQSGDLNTNRSEMTQLMEEKVLKELKKVLTRTPITKLESELLPLLKIEKIGTKSSPRKFVFQHLKAAIPNLNKRRGDMPNREFLLKAILLKYQHLED